LLAIGLNEGFSRNVKFISAYTQTLKAAIGAQNIRAALDRKNSIKVTSYCISMEELYFKINLFPVKDVLGGRKKLKKSLKRYREIECAGD
jgi:hypothetical protein